MDRPATTRDRPSGIPRPSRLPVPRSGVRPSPSRENLQQSKLGISNPRLRSTPSREVLSAPSSKRAALGALSTQKSFSQLRNSSLATNKPENGRVQPQLVDDGTPGGTSRSLGSTETMASSVEASEMKEEQAAEQEITGESHHAAKPSLSERAIESLQNVPDSPAIRRRTSNFFNPESPMRPPSSGTQSSRPGSSYSSTMRPPSRTNSSRPSSRSGQTTQPSTINLRATSSTLKAPDSPLIAKSPEKRPSLSNLRTPSANRQTMGSKSAQGSKISSPGFAGTGESSPSSNKPIFTTSSAKVGSQSVSAKPKKPRASLNGLMKKASVPALDQAHDLDRIGFGAKKKPKTFSNTSSEGTSITSKASKASTATSASNDGHEATPRKSSLALRDQIAKAKAAKRAAAVKDNPEVALSEEPVIARGNFDFGLSDDPFNQQIRQDGGKGLLKKRIAAARSDGRLNIAAMGLRDIPEDVLNMYDLESIGAQGGSWAESVDLTRFIAAGNELEQIGDDVFPDIDPRQSVDDEDVKGNQFGGLETLDLHGNILITIPQGLRRLEYLTMLNLANNKLGNGCYEIISQIPSLRDLKLASNSLSGPLESSLTRLVNLEVLDLQHNALTTLPDGLAELVRLRVMNLTANQFVSLPFNILQRLPLTDIFAGKNRLAGTLISPDVDSLAQLEVLDVTGNSLTGLTVSESLRLPALNQLSISSNRLTSLPEMTSWASLRTLTAEDNNIDSIPEGFVTLKKLKNVDFSGNNIRILDDRIGIMESLDIFRISGNPLREKKLSSMTIEELKRLLKSRMEPEEVIAEKDVEGDGSFYSASTSPVSSSNVNSVEWPVQSGGILDRSNTGSYSLNPVVAAHIAATNHIKTLELHHNVFKEIPSSIAFFAATLTTLSLAHNELTSDTFMKDQLELPTLKELNISSNTFNSLQPLIQNLHAPNLERLDISFNRLTSLPPLKPHFPSLTALFASNNTIRELSPESIKGLVLVDCSSNDINSLNARIGLLGGPGGLQRLDVSGNRFRVPKYTVLEKGTEATLNWLRDRIPAGEGAPPDESAD